MGGAGSALLPLPPLHAAINVVAVAKQIVICCPIHLGVGGVSNTGADAVGVGAIAVVLSVALDVPPPHAVINAAKQQYTTSLISIPLNNQ
jgi:hypothetical protein